MSPPDTRPTRAGMGAVLVLGLAVRLVYLAGVGDVMHGDEAVTGLMALRIARGDELPLMFWGAHYTGTLQAWMAAPVFLVAGATPFALRVVTLPFVLVAIAATGATAARLWGRGAGLVASVCLATGSPVLLYYTTQAIGAYAEALCASALLLWLASALALDESMAERRSAWLGLGVLGGFGVYSSGLVAPVLAGGLLVLVQRRAITRRRARAAAAGFAIGFLPFIVYNVVHPAASMLRLGGRVFGISRADVTGSADAAASGGRVASILGGYLRQLGSFPLRLIEGAPQIVGLPDGLATGVVVISAGVVAIVVALRVARRESAPSKRDGASPTSASPGRALVVAAAVMTVAFVGLLNLDHPRHLIVLYPVGALLAAAGWARARVIAAPIVALVLVLNVVALVRGPALPDLSVRELRDWLGARGVRAVYTDYAIAYPLLFLSREQIVASPAAGPVNVDRRPEYTRAVARSTSPPAYVFRRDTDASRVFASEMRRVGVGSRHMAVGAFDVYLPETAVHPGDLGLQRMFTPGAGSK